MLCLENMSEKVVNYCNFKIKNSNCNWMSCALEQVMAETIISGYGEDTTSPNLELYYFYTLFIFHNRLRKHVKIHNMSPI